MKIKAIKCPECGAPIQFDTSKMFIYCSHCGSKLIVEDQSNETISMMTKEQEFKHEIILNKQKDKQAFIYIAILMAMFLILVLTLFIVVRLP